VTDKRETPISNKFPEWLVRIWKDYADDIKFITLKSRRWSRESHLADGGRVDADDHHGGPY
jgi:hypothetical protein